MPHCYEFLDAELADLRNPRLLFSCENCEGEKLFPPGVVFASLGASVYSFAPGHRAHKFSLLTRRWTQVSKLFPRRCKLMASTVGRHVILIACNTQNNDDEEGHGSDGEEFSGTVCEILDTHTNEWACTEGLPDLFYGTYCISHQGTVFVKEGTTDGSSAVYRLDLTKRRWVEDARMSAMLHCVPDEGKLIIIDFTAVLLAKRLPDMVVLRHISEDGKCDVFSFMLSLPGGFFLFRQDEQLFLVVPSGASSWQSTSVYYCHHQLIHQLKIVSIPGDLLAADAISG